MYRVASIVVAAFERRSVDPADGIRRRKRRQRRRPPFAWFHVEWYARHFKLSIARKKLASFKFVSIGLGGDISSISPLLSVAINKSVPSFNFCGRIRHRIWSVLGVAGKFYRENDTAWGSRKNRERLSRGRWRQSAGTWHVVCRATARCSGGRLTRQAPVIDGDCAQHS